jgi:hypothetical protein
MACCPGMSELVCVWGWMKPLITTDVCACVLASWSGKYSVYVFGQSDVYERIICYEFGRILFSRRSTSVPRHNWSSTHVRRRRHDDFKVAIELWWCIVMWVKRLERSEKGSKVDSVKLYGRQMTLECFGCRWMDCMNVECIILTVWIMFVCINWIFKYKYFLITCDQTEFWQFIATGAHILRMTITIFKVEFFSLSLAMCESFHWNDYSKNLMNGIWTEFRLNYFTVKWVKWHFDRKPFGQIGDEFLYSFSMTKISVVKCK